MLIYSFWSETLQPIWLVRSTPATLGKTGQEVGPYSVCIHSSVFLTCANRGEGALASSHNGRKNRKCLITTDGSGTNYWLSLGFKHCQCRVLGTVFIYIYINQYISIFIRIHTHMYTGHIKESKSCPHHDWFSLTVMWPMPALWSCFVS